MAVEMVREYKELVTSAGPVRVRRMTRSEFTRLVVSVNASLAGLGGYRRGDLCGEAVLAQRMVCWAAAGSAKELGHAPARDQVLGEVAGDSFYDALSDADLKAIIDVVDAKPETTEKN